MKVKSLKFATGLAASGFLTASGHCKLYKTCKWLILLQVVAASGLLQMVKLQVTIFKLQVPFAAKPLTANKIWRSVQTRSPQIYLVQVPIHHPVKALAANPFAATRFLRTP